MVVTIALALGKVRCFAEVLDLDLDLPSNFALLFLFLLHVAQQR
jgi:hypothetical protein